MTAEQSASSPVEGEVTDAEAERFCELVNWHPDGSEWKSVEGVMHEVKFRDLAKGYLRAALSALTTRSVAVSSEAMAEAEGALKGIAGNETFMRRNKVAVSAWALASLLNQARKPEGTEPVAWQSMDSAPKGAVTEDVGCRGESVWFLGRVAERYRAGRPEYIVIKRRGWPNEDSWVCAGETYYMPDFFDAWSPLHARPAHEAGEVRKVACDHCQRMTVVPSLEDKS